MIIQRCYTCTNFGYKNPPTKERDAKSFSENTQAVINTVVAGFGKIEWLERDQVVLGRELTGTLEEDEPDILKTMNRDHGDEVMLLANLLLGADPGPWEMVGIDPQGADIAAAARHLRLEFTEPVSSGEDARAALIELTREARARGDA